MKIKKLPVGIENFKELIDNDFYYVDKTDFIAQTFKDKVALYTRPRRFGKTLNMSMLKYFYSVHEKPANEQEDLFKGLKISENEEAKRHKNRYPVISISFKDLKTDSFASFISFFSSMIQELYDSFPELLESENLSKTEKRLVQLYSDETTDPNDLAKSLRILSRCLYKHYKEKVIILIDEYDVPLESAFHYGHYEEMTNFMRSFLSPALKTNDYLEKGILTGCLRISQESIFTGLNNFSVYSVMEYEAACSFGFTQKEVNQMYKAYGFSHKLCEVRKWYDGYLFGNTEIYNPWSTLQYLKSLLANPDEEPASFWANSSSNDLVTHYIQQADSRMMADFQALADGKTITKQIFPNLTYREMENPDNVYSFLLLTGYLKATSRGKERNTWELKIPNLEVKEIYEQHFKKYFAQIKNKIIPELLMGLKHGDEQKVQNLITQLLDRYISFNDSHENYYHGFMTGTFTDRDGWDVQSNLEAGDGRFDIRLNSNDGRHLIIMECKKSRTLKSLEKDAEKGARQIHKKRYLDNARAADYPNRVGYGVSFLNKSCRVKKLDDELRKELSAEMNA